MQQKYCRIPVFIFEDNRLNSKDVALLASLFYLAGEEGDEFILKPGSNRINKISGLSSNEVIQSIKRLKKLDWIDLNESDYDSLTAGEKTRMELLIPAAKNDPYHQAGSRIAREWSQYFGTRVIKYEDVQDLKQFVIDGMDEELVLKVMDYSGKKAEGDPFRYARSILIDLFNRGILSIKDYNNYRQGREEKNGQEFSGNDSKQEKRDEDEVAGEYYKKGYR